jgi:hypothetical protein
MKKLFLALFLLLPTLALAQGTQFGDISAAKSYHVWAVSEANAPLTTGYTNWRFSLTKPDGTDTTWYPTTSGGSNDCVAKTYTLYCEITAANLDQVGGYTLAWEGATVGPGVTSIHVNAVSSNDHWRDGDVATAASIRTEIDSNSTQLASIRADVPDLFAGTADSGTTTTFVDTGLTQSDTDYWKGSLVRFTNGTLDKQTRLITGFNTSTDTVTFAPATTVAVGTHSYEFLPFSFGTPGIATLPRATAFSNYPLRLRLTSDKFTAVTGATVTCTRSLDGAAFAGCTTSASTEVASGWYKHNLSAADLTGDVIILRFTSTGGSPGTADVYEQIVLTQR